MSSRSSTATLHDDDDDLRAMLDAMAQSSPIQPGPATASKRRHGAVSGDDANDGTSDNENPGILPVVTNQNMAVAARTYGQRKRLRAEQLTELDVFLNVGRAWIVLIFLARPHPHSFFTGSGPSPRCQASREHLFCRQSSRSSRLLAARVRGILRSRGTVVL